MVKHGGLPGHVLAGAPVMGKRERYMLRTGKMPGKSGKQERKIIVMREEAQRRRQQAEEAAERKSGGDDGQTSTGEAPAAAATSSKGVSKPCAADEHRSLRLLALQQERDQEARAEAAANTATPAAASFVAALRAQMGVSGDQGGRP